MKAWLFLILLSVTTSVNSATLSTPDEAKSFSFKVMNLFLNEKFDEGLNISKTYWPLPPVEIDSLANTIKQQWPIVKQRFGKSTGVELVKKEKIGKSFIKFYFLHKFENHALYWTFSFYKPKKTWKINSITYKDDLEILFTKY